MFNEEEDPTNCELAAAWISAKLTSSTRERIVECDALPPHSIVPGDDEDWASFEVMDLDMHDPARALDVAFQIARASSDAWVLCMVGCGTLETVLNSDPTMIDFVAAEARANPRLIEALGHVWRGRMSDQTWAAVQRIVAG